jgi:serine/threonine protein kinase
VPEPRDQRPDMSAEKPDPLIGVKLGGQYTIVGVLGLGGLGKIYRGHQEMVDRPVAIKFLPSELAKDQVIVKRMAREGKALGRLNHPNIVTTFDFGFTEKREPYLVLELVDGETLQAHLDRLGPMPFTACVPIFIQLADAMKYAHANGVVHRDLKPHNIMLLEADGKTSVKILDFGIAQMESEAQKLTLAGEVWGSPHYMSPEQCCAEPVDHLTDIYSLGIVMYCALSNRLPHKGGSFAEVVSQKLFEPVPSFAILDPEPPVSVPLGLERIVFKCLRRKSAERYQSMEELKRALEAFAKQAGCLDGGSSAKNAEQAGQSALAARGPSVRRPNTLHRLEPSTGSEQPARSGAYRAVSPASGEAGGLTGKKRPNLILPAMALITFLLVVAVALLVGMAIGGNRFHPPRSDSRPGAQPTSSNSPELSAPIQTGRGAQVNGQPQLGPEGQPTPGPKEITPSPDLARPMADKAVKPEEEAEGMTAADGATASAVKQAVPDKETGQALTRAVHRAHPPFPARMYTGTPNGQDSTSEASPVAGQHEPDPNNFYRQWGGVKDEH